MLQIENCALVEINVRWLRRLAVLYPTATTKWRRVALILPFILLSLMQITYLCKVWVDLPLFILNMFFVVVIFQSILRTAHLVNYHVEFEEFLAELVSLFMPLESSDDDYIRQLLQEAVDEALSNTKFNYMAGVVNVTVALLLPIVRNMRSHPLGVAIPFVDVLNPPVFELLYFMQALMPVVLTLMYMPFICLFVSFAVFGKAMLQIVAYKLSLIEQLPEKERYPLLNSCIYYHSRIARYVKLFEALFANVVGIEVLIFGGITCALLFVLNMVTSTMQTVFMISFALTMLYELFIYYKYANDVLIESTLLAQAVYNIPWYECNKRFCQSLLLFLMQTQNPLAIKVGNIYPMTLAMFQSLLNTYYSYFAMLRRVTNN
ncbi:Or43a [Drosophila busckii]|uniref:Odorant receptor n=1 Tax=Drosophila busckii TaxID=30019 RepID=A0A0M3QUU3_DROBS|nr:odorant receptor 43a [Drosophila busckii]ALC41233.1 Or43a [Drosophila busckii]